MEISLTETERRLLIEVLEREIREVRSEVYHAESHDVKEMLKERAACVRGLLVRVQGTSTANTPT